MKQLLLSLAILVTFLGTVSAQMITIDPILVDANFDGVLLNGSQDLSTEHVAVTNNTGDTLRLKWRREVPVDCPAWRTQVCDNSYCFAFSASTNYNPPQIEEPFRLSPGETFHDFIFHVWPDFAPGCCVINIHFSTIENPDDIIATLSYDVRVNDPECAISSTTTEPSVLEALQAYPNPSTGEFSIADNPLVKSIAVYNLMGQQVARFAHANGDSHDIGNSPDGLYLLGLQDENGETIKTVRMNKQSIQP